MTPRMWLLDFFWKYFLVCNFLLAKSTSAQTMKLTFGRNKFGKRTLYSLQTKIQFY